jgi:ankyrin repeat protein
MNTVISFLCILSFVCLTYGMEQNTITLSETPYTEFPVELIEIIAARCNQKNILARLNKTWNTFCSKKNITNILKHKTLALSYSDKQYFLNVYAYEGNLAIVTNLLNINADINVQQDTFGMSPLACACDNLDNAKMIDFLLKRGAMKYSQKTMSPLYKAIYYGKIDMIRSLVDLKESINEECYFQKVPLMLASDLGNYEIVQLLMVSGANIEAKDNDGMTALSFACRSGHVAIIELLLKSGVNIEAKDKNDWTVLHISCNNNQFDSVQVLLNNKANINVANDENQTPLYIACEEGNPYIVQLLLESGADTRIGNPLQLAYNKGYNNIVKLFVDHLEQKQKKAVDKK